jgi:hypothetical protein
LVSRKETDQVAVLISVYRTPSPEEDWKNLFQFVEDVHVTDWAMEKHKTNFIVTAGDWDAHNTKWGCITTNETGLHLWRQMKAHPTHQLLNDGLEGSYSATRPTKLESTKLSYSRCYM